VKNEISKWSSPSESGSDKLVHYRVMHLRRSIRLVGSPNLNMKNIASEFMASDGLDTHELNVLSIFEEVWTSSTLGGFCCWVGLCYISTSVLGKGTIVLHGWPKAEYSNIRRKKTCEIVKGFELLSKHKSILK
jgi:hypothetical protein